MTGAQSKLEWQRALTTLAAVTVFVVIVAAAYWARSVFIPVALAVFFTFVTAPPVSWLERKGLPRLAAVLVTLSGAALVILAVGALFAWQMSGLAATLPGKTDQIKRKLIEAKEAVVGTGESKLGKMADDIASVFAPEKGPAAPQAVVVEPKGASWTGHLGEVVNPVAELAGQIVLAGILSVFMQFRREDLRNRLIRLTGGGSRVTTTTRAVDDASQRVSRYLLNQFLLNAGVGTAVAIGLAVVGVQASVVWGLVAAVMRYVPYIGMYVAAVPPIALSFATSEGWGQPIAAVAVYLVIELISNNVMEPWLYGTSLGLSEVAQLVAAAFWAFLWGPVGLILSGPLTTCLLVLGKYSPRLEFLEVLLGDEPALSPDVRLYQRLAARDQDEAAEIAREELKRGTPEEVFDRVVVPALSFAKRDAAQENLSADDLAGMVATTREIIDDLMDHRLLPAAAPAADPTAAPPATRVRVLAVPAKDDADQVVLEMLQDLLDSSKWEVEVAAEESLSSELLQQLERSLPGVIVIGSLPPGGLAHTRYLCKRIGKQFPDVRLVVGRWGLTGDEVETNRKQLTEAGADYLATSLADMTANLAGWRQVFLSQQEPAGKTPGHKPVGTGPA